MRRRKREWYRANRAIYNATNRRSRLKTQYGMTEADFDQMIVEQEGRCAICAGDFASTKDAHIDHCHETGIVRGLLCLNCNVTLGLMKDSVLSLQAAIEYLKKER